MALNSDLQIRNNIANGECKRRCYKKASNRKMFGDGMDRGSTSSGISNVKSHRVPSPYINQSMVKKTQNNQYQIKKIAQNRMLIQNSLPIHKANSDEISKSINERKKVKKSVLTLPNNAKISDIARVTVSDMNESEYDNVDNNKYNRKLKKRLHRFSRQTKTVEKENYKCYNRDELYCTQLDFDVRHSSANVMNNISYGKITNSNRRLKNNKSNKDLAPCNIWALLKNVNPFPFRPSPAISEESIEEPKKRKCSKKLKKNLGPHIYKTRQTEEFAYVSSVELNSTSPSFSRSSSFDRVTVIDKHNNTYDSQDSFQEKKLLDTTLTRSTRLSMKYNNKPLLQHKRETVNDNYRNNNYLEYEHKKPTPKIFTNSKQHSYIKDDTDKSYGNECLSYSTKASLGEDNMTKTYTCAWKSTRKFAEPKSKMSPKSSVRRVSETKTGRVDDTLMANQNQKERKFRLLTTMPSSSIKMTQQEIKRRLMLLKYPLVILGKDQVSSTFRVEHHTPVQFSGLDDHIWPFMAKWTHNKEYIRCQENDKIRARNNFISRQLFSNNVKQNFSKSKDLNVNTELTITDRFGKFNVNNTKSRIPRFAITGNVIDLLHKNSSESTVYIEEDTSSRRDIDSVIDVGYGKINKINKSNTVNTYRGNVICMPKPNMNNNCQVWSRSKWSSDFINTIMVKMNEGVYFNNQIPDTVNRVYRKHLDKGTDIPFIGKDVFVQTKKKPINLIVPKNPVNVTSEKDQWEHSIPLDQFRHILKSIPGFDRPSSNLKVECLKENQVVVKHCSANILIEFDVSGEDKGDDIQYSDTMQISDNYTLPLTTIANNVYKCKDIILNEKLPEQLCTLLPNIIGSIEKKIPTPIDSMQFFQNQSQLMTIPEVLSNNNKLCFPLSIQQYSMKVNRNRCTDMVLYNEKSQYNKIFEKLSLHDLRNDIIIEACSDCNVNIKENLQSEIPKYSIYGVFGNKKGISHNKIHYTCIYNKDESRTILKKYNNLNFICSPGILKTLNLFVLNIQSKPIRNELAHIELKSITTSIVPYDKKSNYFNNEPNIERVITAFWNFISNNMPNIKVLGPTRSNLELLLFNNNKDKDDAVIQFDLKTYESESSIPINELEQREFKEYNHEEKEISDIIKNSDGKLKIKVVRKNKIISQRRKYKRNEKNTKATNVITRQNSIISLDTINSIDDFFRIIGIKRALLNVIDGNDCQYAEKILTTLSLLRKWTEDITPNQAFLIFLLINKNESLNLVRFRSLILQGIVMNRITHLSELDMEIKVIEKENLNKWRQYEELSSLQPSVEHNDNLLEELCWIAKTTAADHQKPFDENSKKIIKSLVAKRKSLNPTYLRLMSRYVGLGLLKPQGKYGIKPFKQPKIIAKD